MLTTSLSMFTALMAVSWVERVDCTVSAALAAAVAESLVRERLEYGVFRATMADYSGLTPDGSIRILPAQEVA